MQLLKLVNVHTVTDLSSIPFASRELMLIKVGSRVLHNPCLMMRPAHYTWRDGRVVCISRASFPAFLLQVRCNPKERGELTDLADIFHGNICDVSLSTITLEVQGKEDKMRALQEVLRPYGKPVLPRRCPSTPCLRACQCWPAV